MSKIRILLADDHGVVRKGLRFLLDRQPEMEVVGEAANGRDAVKLAGELTPDVVIMDVAMPQLNGIEATAQIVKRNAAVGVIILSMYSDEGYLVRTLTAGAKGYLLKDSAEADLRAPLKPSQKSGRFSVPLLPKRCWKIMCGNCNRKASKTPTVY